MTLSLLGDWLISTVYGEKILIWHKKEVIATLDCKFTPRSAVVCGTKLIVVGGRENKPLGNVAMWDLQDKSKLQSVEPTTYVGHTGCAWAVVAVEDKNMIISGGYDGVRVWNMANCTQTAFIPNTGKIISLCLYNHNFELIVGNDDGQLLVYSLGSMPPQQTNLILAHSAAINSIEVISATTTTTTTVSTLAITGSADGTVRVWDLAQRTLGVCVGIVNGGGPGGVFPGPVVSVHTHQTLGRKSGEGIGAMVVAACAGIKIQLHTYPLMIETANSQQIGGALARSFIAPPQSP